MNPDISKIFADLLKEQRLSRDAMPPVEKWNPSLCGDMDLVIDRNGHWFHDGAQIQREALVRLFSTILRREGDDHFLVTPVEKLRIIVEDAPFYIPLVRQEYRQGQPVLIFESTTGDTVVAGEHNPIRVEENAETGEPSPYILVRSGMEGLLSRAAFYQLAEWSEERNVDGQLRCGVESLGQFFPLTGD